MGLIKNMASELESIKKILKNKKHGDIFPCPTCSNPNCRLDINTPEGKEPEFEQSVWYNKYTGMFECTECWLK